MHEREGTRLVSEMVNLGVLWRPDGPKELALKGRLWAEALTGEGVAYEEARAAALELSRMPATATRLSTRPGDIAEIVFAARARVPQRKALPDDTRTDDQKRADARRGLQMIREALGERGPEEA